MGFWDTFVDTLSEAADGVTDAISDAVSHAVSGEPPAAAAKGHATMTKLDMLTQMVRDHELYWTALAQQQPTDLLRTFMVSRWDPFYRAWVDHRGHITEYTAPEIRDGFIAAMARELSSLRELARYNYIGTPDLSTAVPGEITVGYHHGGGGGGGWRGGTRRFNMGGGGWGWGGWGYPYAALAQPAYVIPPGCYLDAYGQILCPAPVEQVPASPAVAGWFDDVTGAITGTVKSAVRGVTHVVSSAANTVGHTLKQLKGPIEAAAATAAGAAALAIPGVGPLVAPMASGFARSLVDAAAGSGDVQAAAQQVIAQAVQTAQTDPHVAHAFGLAQEAVAKSAVAYHAVDQVAKAATGANAAAAQLAEIVSSAAAGDPAAQKMMQLAQSAVRAADAQAAPAPAAVSGASRDGSDPRAQARAAAAQMDARVVGIVQRSDGSWALEPFGSSDDADDWFGQWLTMPHAFSYVAYFDKGDATWPGPLNEQLGKAALRDTHVSGFFVPALAGLAGFAAGYFGPAGVKWARAKYDEHRAHGAKAA
jgi:hypothetical protein